MEPGPLRDALLKELQARMDAAELMEKAKQENLTPNS